MRAIRVLVVDDNENDYALIVRALKAGGFDVRSTCADNEIAMQQAMKAGPWDLVCVDWILPKFSAPDAMRILRESGEKAPVIVVSGDANVETAVLAIKLGARDFIPKANLETLSVAVRREFYFDSEPELEK